MYSYCSHTTATLFSYLMAYDDLLDAVVHGYCYTVGISDNEGERCLYSFVLCF